ncbi:MAG TPA: DNRLRE domain-containing protein [Thermodesulfovibrionales bacterium]|nr:DNRLRE domain-containing protein [Thermodesulfovibrionales bacterium]
MKKVSIVVMCVVIAGMISIALPCLTQAAWIATDYQSYAQGDVVKITGFGWQPGESVSLVLYDSTDLVNSYYTFVTPAQADINGIFTDSEYIIQPSDEGRTFLLVAEGSSGSLAQTTFDDAGVLRSFKDATHNIPRDAFAWGATVYARASALNSRPCWQIKWIDPNSNVVATHNLDASTLSTRNDSFVVPASGPSGVWRAELWRPDNNSACPSAFTGPNPQYTLYFDVAQIVIIGADNSYIASHTPGFNSNSSILFKYTLDVNNESGDIEKTFVRFILPSFTGYIKSAKLRMRVLVPPSSSRTYNINRVTVPWDVNVINYTNQPLIAAGPPTDSQPTPTGLSAINSLMRWDVTSDVSGFVNGSFPNNGWRIVDSAATDPEGIFYSTEANTLLGNELEGPVLLIDDPIAFSVPTMTEWGMIIFMILAGLGSVYYLRRRRRV